MVDLSDVTVLYTLRRGCEDAWKICCDYYYPTHANFLNFGVIVKLSMFHSQCKYLEWNVNVVNQMMVTSGSFAPSILRHYFSIVQVELILMLCCAMLHKGLEPSWCYYSYEVETTRTKETSIQVLQVNGMAKQFCWLLFCSCWSCLVLEILHVDSLPQGSRWAMWRELHLVQGPGTLHQF